VGRQDNCVTLAENGGRNSCDAGLAGARHSRGSAEGSVQCTVKIRYNHPGVRATLTPMENERARIRLHEPQKAVTPGQAAVFYDDDVVLGGGWICRQADLAGA
jgi:tRNA U34 2-thiouridine synthase MnmA/TrmU